MERLFAGQTSGLLRERKCLQRSAKKSLARRRLVK